MIGDRADLEGVTHPHDASGDALGQFFLDGFPATNAVGWDFPVRTVRSVEVYRSLFEVPPEFQRSNLRCGVIAIWSRQRGDAP